ncbi:MAG: hypothetical protein RLZZ319_47 [Actinomycetota bacterium]
MSTTATAGTRRDIQYLRALAVTSVVLFHFWPTRLVSGFLGVDVFFVISGFLITSLIVREVTSTNRFSITAFWVRRIRRIFPAAITVIAATVAAVYATHLAEQAFAIGRHAFASAFSAENLLLSVDAVDYVHRTDQTSPLQHYWSLSVEEQFYIVWPLIVIIPLWWAKRSSTALTRILAIALGVVGVGSFAYAVFMVQGQMASYFDPFARAWELALGAAVAIWLSTGASITTGRTVVNRVGWVLLAASFAIPGLESLAPGLGILPAALATAAVLATGPVERPTRIPFAKQALSAIEWAGDRSYSIYLWHWPILLLAPAFLGHELGTVSKLGAIALTLVLAELSYRFIENPVRHATRPWSRSPLIMGGAALVVSAAVVAATFLTIPNFGKQETDVDLQAMMLDTPLPSDAPGADAEFPYTSPYCDGAGAAIFDCETRPTVEFDPYAYPISPPRTATCQYEVETFIEDCVMGDVSADRSIALVGDSHARAMWASLDTIGLRAGYAVHEFLTPRCPYRLKHFPWCDDHNRSIEPRLNSGEFDLVVLAQQAGPFNPDEPDVVKPFDELYAELLANGIPTVIIKDNPHQETAMLQCLQQNPIPGECTRPGRERLDRATETANRLGIPVVNLDRIYCPDGTCYAAQGGMLVWRDNNHISPFFHKSLSPLLWSKLMELGLISPR